MRKYITALVLLVGCGAEPDVFTNDNCFADVNILPMPSSLRVGDSARVFARPDWCLGAKPPFHWSITDTTLATVRAVDDSSAMVFGRAPGEPGLLVRASNGPAGARRLYIVPRD
jgi:hypothetical protein